MIEVVYDKSGYVFAVRDNRRTIRYLSIIALLRRVIKYDGKFPMDMSGGKYDNEMNEAVSKIKFKNNEELKEYYIEYLI